MTELFEYAGHLNASGEITAWLNTAGRKAIKDRKATVSELEHVLDFFVSVAAPSRLQKMSVVDAKRKAKEWSEANQKKGRDLTDGPDDIETLHDFGDGSKIVKLKSKQALQREGFLMSHCSGGYNPESALIYSYRDAQNMPHATFEVQKNSEEIIQIKGKGNGPIHPKCIHPILAFLKAVGMEIRPSDMVNLGYHHIDAGHLDFLQRYPAAEKQLAIINGEAYAF